MSHDTYGVIIRQATRDDLAAVHGLVRELAIYEHAEDAFEASLETYERDFDAGIFEALVADHDGDIAGMMLYYMAYSTWKGKMLFLEDFVVKEAYRRHHIGQQLFDALLDTARKKGCVLVKWQVLDWNEPALRFYEKNRAIIEKEWWNGKFFL
ncbi:MAG: GNAT family N-acetyltransferase [Saprospiraceae bacterium]|nr:GNAT family N-acetyltransferase [Saprospiraceae bacterium]